MPVPESTSVEGFERFVGGRVLRAGRGEAWREVKAWIVAPPRKTELLTLPAVSEPFLAWTISGEADFQEREGDGPWVTNRISPGSFFLTSGGAPYDCRWKTVSDASFETLLVFLELPLLQRALAEAFGKRSGSARLRDLSGFRDPVLEAWMQQLRTELLRRTASPLCVQGLGQAIAVHLARHYAELARPALAGIPSLPGHKLRQVTDWMAAHLADEFQLERAAAQAGLSKFHFHRLFKRATGTAPARFHTNLRLDAARRLLRETRRSVVEIGLELGYANPSHFAQVFRRATGLTPSAYRRQR